MKTGNFISVDFETATASREPCQIGIVVVRNWDIVQKMSYLIKPKDNYYDSFCTDVHGISSIHTNNAPSFLRIWEKVKKYFDNATVIMHNASFDADVLTKAINNYNLEHPVCEFVCTYNLTGLRLEKACNIYDIPLVNHHDAMFDAEAAAKLFVKLINEGASTPPISPKLINSKKTDYPKYDKTQLKEEFEFFEDELNTMGVKECDDFKDKRFLITGTFEHNREGLKASIKALGGLNSTTVNKSLAYAVLGDNPGPSKEARLEQFINAGILVNMIDENILLDMIEKSFEKQGKDIAELSYY